MMHPFELLATPIRRRIVEVLAVGEHTSGELSNAVGHEFNVTAQAIAHHLRMLRDNDIVRVTAEETTGLPAEPADSHSARRTGRRTLRPVGPAIRMALHVRPAAPTRTQRAPQSSRAQ
jgi:DNA-binding transcriptional ArsR family regulator